MQVRVDGDDAPKRIKSLNSSGFPNVLMDNLAMYNVSTLTSFQSHAIPIIMSGRDLMASTQTGSGKTVAYVIPILHNLICKPETLSFNEEYIKPHVIILAPTKELAKQISNILNKFGTNMHVKCIFLNKGRSDQYHKTKFFKDGIHVLVATPGRLITFVNKGIVILSSVKIFILDETDKMLDLNLKQEIEQILKHPTMTSKSIRQTLMFSAKFTNKIKNMAKFYLKPNKMIVAVGVMEGMWKYVEQTVKKVNKFDKKIALLSSLKEIEDGQSKIVFVQEKRVTDYIATYLSENDFPAICIHGQCKQAEREQTLINFKANEMKILVATTIASERLDIKDIHCVVNYDLPKSINEYISRIRHTGRLGNSGKAISFFDSQCDGSMASELITILKQVEQEIPPWLIKAADDFNDLKKQMSIKKKKKNYGKRLSQFKN